MKFRRITLGMGYGDYWNDHSAFETNSKTDLLIGAVEEQQAIIQKQKSQIDKITTMVAELKSEIEKKLSKKIIQNIL